MQKLSEKFETELIGSQKIMDYLKNPFVCAGIVAVGTYFIFSNNYIL